MSATEVRGTSGGGEPTSLRALRFGILGPLEVESDGERFDLGGPKQHTVLAYLLIRANSVVTAETLKECLWGEDPPESAGNVLQTYVSHLRRAIGRERIVAQAAGYRLRVGPSELDAERFETLVREGRASAPESPELAAGRLEAALRLWRGPALANVREDAVLVAEAARLDELRMEAQEARIEAYLASGQQARAVGDLEVLVAERPLRESLWSLLIRSLYQQGRQADALDAYLRARRVLRDELGIDPSPELTRLQKQVLDQDPSLVVGWPPASRVPAARARAGGVGWAGVPGDPARRRTRCRDQGLQRPTRVRPRLRPAIRAHGPGDRTTRASPHRTGPRLLARARARLSGQPSPEGRQPVGGRDAGTDGRRSAGRGRGAGRLRGRLCPSTGDRAWEPVRAGGHARWRSQRLPRGLQRRSRPGRGSGR